MNMDIKNVIKAVLQNYAILDFLATLILKPVYVENDSYLIMDDKYLHADMSNHHGKNIIYYNNKN